MGKMVKADDNITAGLLNVVAGLHGGNIESAFASFNSINTTNADNKSSEEKKEDSITAEATKEVSNEQKKNESISDETSETTKEVSTKRSISENPYAFENIIRKANEDKKIKQFWIKEETLDMLDAIIDGSNIKIGKASILHNLVATFLNENLPTLKANYEKKCKESKKKNYLK